MRWLLAALALTLTGCASSNAPSRFLPATAAQASTEVHGGWATVRLRGAAVLSGELLAVGPDSVYVLPPVGAVRAAARDDVATARVEVHRGAGLEAGTWTAVGIISTLSHGMWAILSAPIWLLTGSVAASVASRSGFRTYPRTDWERIAPYARFPQGLPPGGDRGGNTFRSRRPSAES